MTHNTLNRLRRTVVVIPLSSSADSNPPITVSVTCEDQPVVAVIDQVRAVAKHRFKSKLSSLTPVELDQLDDALSTILEIP